MAKAERGGASAPRGKQRRPVDDTQEEGRWGAIKPLVGHSPV